MIQVADLFLIYTILAPIIFVIVGYYFNLEENFIRTLVIIQGPAIIAWCIYAKSFGKRFVRTNWEIYALVICLLVVVFLSGFRNLDSFYAKEGIKFFLAYCFLGFFLGTISSLTIKRSITFCNYWNYYTVMLIAFLFVSIIFMDFKPIDPKIGRFRMAGDNSARTAIVFYFLSFCSLSSFLFSNRLVPKLLFGLLFFICVFLAVVAKSRSAVIIYTFLLFFFFTFHFIQNKSKIQKYSLIFILALLVVSSGLVLSTAQGLAFKNRFLTILKTSEYFVAYILDNDTNAYKSINRLPLWRDAFFKFRDRPIFGNGYGTQYYHEILAAKRTHPHSLILQFMAETGIIGLGIFVSFVTLVMRKAVKNYYDLQKNDDKLIYLIYPLSFIFFLLFSCFHFAIHENYFFWYFAGIIVGFDTSENGKYLSQNGTDFHKFMPEHGSKAVSGNPPSSRC